MAVLEFDVDDMTGEEIAVAADRLRMETGVIDVSVGTRHGKKGRPLAEFRLLAQAGCDGRDRASLLHRNLDAGTALARGAPARAAPNRGRGGGRRRRRQREGRLAPRRQAHRKAAHDDVAATRGLGARRRRARGGRGARARV